MNRMYSPSPTVRSHPIPLYMRGFPALLGQDTLDPTLFNPIFDPGVDLTPPTFPDWSMPIILPDPNALPIDPTIFDPTGPLVAPPNLPTNTQDIANLYAGAVATGTITPQQAAAAAAGVINSTANLIKSTTGPSPRVAVRPPGTGPSASGVMSLLSRSTLIHGVPDGVLLVAALAAFALTARGR